MSLKQLEEACRDLIGGHQGPVVAYTELFSISRALGGPVRQQPAQIVDMLFRILGPSKDLLMPVYTNGFRNGVIDLDEEPATTGVINEFFRKHYPNKRSASAFFSFAVSGPSADLVHALRPFDSWGEGSVFDWLHNKNALFLMLGAKWETCIMKHRAEWLARVPYRYEKIFSGQMILAGKSEKWTERLFVRSLDPLAENDWRPVEELFSKNGMKSIPFGGGSIAAMTANPMLDCMKKVLEINPYAFVENANALKRHFG